jgi:hypothetical protein
VYLNFHIEQNQYEFTKKLMCYSSELDSNNSQEDSGGSKSLLEI